MAPRNRYCPLCNTHIWYSQKSLGWYAKDGTNCVGDTLMHCAPVASPVSAHQANLQLA